MDIQVLRNYIEIIESGSITAAAKRLYIAQPALSLQLKSLEKELGSVLLIRSAHRLELTDAGLMLYKNAKNIVALENSVKKDVRDCELGLKGVLRLGMTPSIGYTLCDGILTEFARTHPGVRCELHEANSHEVITMLDSGICDIAVVRTPCVLSPEMTAVRYAADKIAAVYNKERFGFDGNEEISVSRLYGRPLAVIRRYEKLINDVFAAHSENLRKSEKNPKAPLPDTVCSATELATVLRWAEEGLGIGIVPYSVADSLKDNPQMSCRVINDPSFNIEIIAVTKKNVTLSAAEKQFYEMFIGRNSR